MEGLPGLKDMARTLSDINFGYFQKCTVLIWLMQNPYSLLNWSKLSLIYLLFYDKLFEMRDLMNDLTLELIEQ